MPVRQAVPPVPDPSPAATVVLRDARPAELAILTDVAHAAKRYWDYPEEWIEAWRPALTVAAEDLARWTVVVAEWRGEVAGFAAVDVAGSPAVLEHLWVRPERVRQGIGRRLLERCASLASSAGHQFLETDADPHALPFYRAMGGDHVGEVRADVLGVTRTLPRVRFRLSGRVGTAGLRNGGTDDLAS